jgi:hypothetical protein
MNLKSYTKGSGVFSKHHSGNFKYANGRSVTPEQKGYSEGKRNKSVGLSKSSNENAPGII